MCSEVISTSEPKIDYTHSTQSILSNNYNYPDNGHYLIITPPEWENYLQPLLDWKLRKGHPVSVATTDIAGPASTDIQDYLQSAMETWENPPVYLLLIGDVDAGVPSHYIAEPGSASPQYVTDHPYSLLTGGDMFPDLFVGRLTVDTISELLVVINKIMLYEKTPYVDGPNWLDNAHLLCTILDASSTQPNMNWVRNKMLDYGYSRVDTSYDPMQNDMVSVTTPINSGVGFVNYRGTGAANGFWVGGRNFVLEDLDGLHNGPMLPIVTIMTCGGGAFGDVIDPSLGESWLRSGTIANPKGAVAYIGPSSTNTHTKYNNIMNIGFYSGLFDQDLYTLGEALWAGKLEMWNNYGDAINEPWGQSAPYYHHLYNLQGDPGLQVRKRMPEFLSVSHPDTLYHTSDNITISVTDSFGSPVEGYVCVYDQISPLGIPLNGVCEVTLPLNLNGIDSLQLTVSGPDLYPYLKTIPIVQVAESVSLTEWAINEDFAVSGDSISISMTFDNQGPTVENARFVLQPEKAEFFSFDELRIHIDSIQGATSSTFEINLPGLIVETAPHGAAGNLFLTGIGSMAYVESFKPLTIQSPTLELSTNTAFGDSVSPGDTISYSIQIFNAGGVQSDNAWIRPLPNEWGSVLTDTLFIDPISVDDLLELEEEIVIEIGPQFYDGQVVTMHYEVGYRGSVDTLTQDLSLGGSEPYAPSAPDDYGYYVFDLNDQSFSKGPSFDWVELDTSLGGSGVPLELFDPGYDQDASIQITLPFDVKYYGETFSRATICTNGWLSFGSSTEVSFRNRTIPSPSGPIAMVAPYWDDLIYDDNAVYTHHDTHNARFIIEWSNVESFYVNEPFSFQVIIFDPSVYPTPSGDSDILFQYLEFEQSIFPANYCTIGIESPDYATGSLVSYNNEWFSNVAPLADMSAILFTTDRGLRIAPTSIENESVVLPTNHILRSYPNPFNPSTNIEYELPAISDVSLIVYDIAGREVQTLVYTTQGAGSYTSSWNGTDQNGRQVSGGMYFARLQAGENSSVIKMVYLR